MIDEKQQTPTSPRRVVYVHSDDLPVHCPMPQSTLWSLHPRVYIPLQEGDTEPVICPYCGTAYALKQD